MDPWKAFMDLGSNYGRLESLSSHLPWWDLGTLQRTLPDLAAAPSLHIAWNAEHFLLLANGPLLLAYVPLLRAFGSLLTA